MTQMMVEPAGAERGERQQRDQDDGQADQRFDDAAQDVVDDAAQVTHREAEHDTDHRPENRGRRGDDDDLAGAEDDAAEHVAAEAIGAEEVAFGERPDPLAERILPRRIVARRSDPGAMAQTTQNSTITSRR